MFLKFLVIGVLRLPRKVCWASASFCPVVDAEIKMIFCLSVLTFELQYSSCKYITRSKSMVYFKIEWSRQSHQMCWSQPQQLTWRVLPLPHFDFSTCVLSLNCKGLAVEGCPMTSTAILARMEGMQAWEVLLTLDIYILNLLCTAILAQSGAFACKVGVICLLHCNFSVKRGDDFDAACLHLYYIQWVPRGGHKARYDSLLIFFLLDIFLTLQN
jgi:hypothetical protein